LPVLPSQRCIPSTVAFTSREWAEPRVRFSPSARNPLHLPSFSPAILTESPSGALHGSPTLPEGYGELLGSREIPLIGSPTRVPITGSHLLVKRTPGSVFQDGQLGHPQVEGTPRPPESRGKVRPLTLSGVSPAGFQPPFWNARQGRPPQRPPTSRLAG
jgi:hypothetical protein